MKTPNTPKEWCRLVMRSAILFELLQPAQNLYAQNPARGIKFERISLEQGLSQSTVRCILQDHKGFMWFGTEDGLNKYNGYSFTVYKHDPNNPYSLSHNVIISIYEDRSEVLWIGTQGGGLNKFDRTKETFTHYQHDPNNPNSLSDNIVNSIYEDSDEVGRVLWIGTERGGLNKLDREKETFTHYQHDPNNPNSLGNNVVNSIYKDRSGVLWIGTGGGGLNKLDREKKIFTRYQHDHNNPNSLSNNAVNSIHEDRSGVLWIGTGGGGLNKFDREKETFTHYQQDPNNANSLSGNIVSSIYEDPDEVGRVLWIGTRGGGLNKLALPSPVLSGSKAGGSDREKEKITHYKNNPNNLNSLSHNDVISIYEDQSGMLWIGTWGGGLNRLDREKEKFAHYKNNPNSPNSLSYNSVGSIYEDRSGVLWIGTWGGGLNKFDRKKETFTHYQHDPNNPNSLSDNWVYSIHEDRFGMLWIGTKDGGLNKFDRKKETFTHYQHDPNNPNSLSNNVVHSIYEDRSGVFWIGTWGGGLNKFDREKETFTHYQHDPNNPISLSDNWVYSIYEDRSGMLWIGTKDGGLNKFDRKKESFTHYQHDPNNPNSLSVNYYILICEDRSDMLWIGSAGGGGGLNKFDREKGRITHFLEKDGLPNDTIYGILEDDHGYLWLSTNNGLSKFNPQTKEFKNYDVGDGLQSKEYNGHAYYKSAVSGEMFFGGVNGFNAFHPDSVKDNPYIPPVVITAFARYNTDDVAGKPIAEMGIAERPEIELSYKENILTFEFAALNYRNTFKNRYVYKLEGFNDNWIQLGTKRDVTFTNLDPGDYNLRVKGSNNDGVWNEEGTSLKITITPPWWRTQWAYGFYGLLFIAGVVAADRVQRRRLIRQERERTMQRELEQARELEKTHHALQAAHEHLKATQQQLVTQEKLASLGQLTAGIAHEIKNPLNFVNNFAALSVDLAVELRQEIEKRKAKSEERGAWGEDEFANIDEIIASLIQNAEKINHHGKRADGIVRAMMQHARGGKGERQPTDVNKLVEEYVNLSYHGMRAKVPDFNVSIERDFGELERKIEMVPQEIGRVLLNLLGNAFDAVREKQQSGDGTYSPSVSISTRAVGGAVEIHVRDNGGGISDEVRKKIFEPFFTTKPAGSGTGLGLSLSYDIVTQGHGGTLTVESTKGEGATFIITLPAR